MRNLVPALVALMVLGACTGDGDETAPPRPAAMVAFEGTDERLFVEVADDPDERRRGLMGVEELAADQGMAFVFDEPVGGTFWMKGTLIPLSIAFVGEGGRVVGMRNMDPCEADPCPHYGIDEPYVLAIEANLGWFDEHGVDVGARAELGASPDG
ncbi:MAG: DUF192 domain-containing protein [Actinomycetota bacterium]